MAVNAALDALPPKTYTTTQTAELRNEDGKYLHVVLDVETAGSGTLTLTIYGRCRSRRATNTPNGVQPLYPILIGAAVSTANAANAPNVYRIGPGLTPAATAVANDFLPVLWTIEVAMSTPSSWVYSVQYNVTA